MFVLGTKGDDVSKDSALRAVGLHALGIFLADLEGRKGGRGGARHISCASRLSPEGHGTLAAGRMSHPINARSIATRMAIKQEGALVWSCCTLCGAEGLKPNSHLRQTSQGGRPSL